MNQKTYSLVCGAIFMVVAVAHLTRLIGGWRLEIAGWPAPHWISIPGLLIPGLLSVWGFVLGSRARTVA